MAEERRRSASPPTREGRRRSSSPRRQSESRRSKKSGGGFKWKEKRAGDEGEDSKRLARGYRDTDADGSRRREGDRGEYRDRDRYGDRDRDRSRQRDAERERYADKDRGDPKKYEDRSRDGGRGDAQAEPAAGEGQVRDVFGEEAEKLKKERKKEKKEKKEKKKAGDPTGEAMIIVYVNDRLGTKAAIPCLASDSVKLFKAQVAARIGREPHEIMLKRQGERPFKDMLTLEDYGVSNGVQIDLEVDTGD